MQERGELVDGEGRIRLTVVCRPVSVPQQNEAEQRAILREIQSAARYAAQRGVVIVSSAGNETADLQCPGIDAPTHPTRAVDGRTRRARQGSASLSDLDPLLPASRSGRRSRELPSRFSRQVRSP